MHLGAFVLHLEIKESTMADMLETNTPTLYINGERYAGPRIREALLEVLR